MGVLIDPPATLLRGASLLLDFDGTLVELADRPDAVIVEKRLRDLLDRLGQRLPGRLALISGRAASQVRALIGVSGLAVSGSHGLEIHWPDGRISAAGRPASLDIVLERLDRFASTHPGVLVERKPLSVALHYRMAPDAALACHDLAGSLAAETGMMIQTGKMMVELRPGGHDKGSALRTLMATPPMAGTIPVFLGDDDTDEPAMVAAAALGGAGILVGASRPSAARYRLDSVGAVIDWLDAAAHDLADTDPG